MYLFMYPCSCYPVFIIITRVKRQNIKQKKSIYLFISGSMFSQMNDIEVSWLSEEEPNVHLAVSQVCLLRSSGY